MDDRVTRNNKGMFDGQFKNTEMGWDENIF